MLAPSGFPHRLPLVPEIQSFSMSNVDGYKSAHASLSTCSASSTVASSLKPNPRNCSETLPRIKLLSPQVFHNSNISLATFCHNMTYNMHRYETLRRLGIEHLPPIVHSSNWHHHDHSIRALKTNMPVRTMPVGLDSCPQVCREIDIHRSQAVAARAVYRKGRQCG